MKKSLFVAMVSLMFAFSAQAAEYSVMPLALNFDVAKRDIINETITLANKSDRMVRLYASVNEVATDREGVLESFVSPSMSDRTNTPTSWIEITRARIELAPGEVRDIPFTIRMNPNTQPGRYSVFIGFAQAANQPEAVQKIVAGDAPGVLINLSVDEKQNQFLRLAHFSVDRFMTGSALHNLFYALENPSAIDVVHGGEMILYNTRGIEITSVPLNSDGLSIETEKEREFAIALPEDLPWGKYKALLMVEYGDHMTTSLQDTTFFYIIPIWQLIALFLTILTIALLLTFWFYYKNAHYQHEYDESSVTMFVKEGISEAKDHDVNLKQRHE